MRHILTAPFEMNCTEWVYAIAQLMFGEGCYPRLAKALKTRYYHCDACETDMPHVRFRCMGCGDLT